VGAGFPLLAAARGDVQDLVKVRGGTVLAWSLYELGATSFAMNMLSFYFPLDIATRVARGNERFSIVFSCSMLVVAIAAPLLGHLADRRGKRRLLIPFVLSGITLTALVAATGPVWRVLAFFALANIAFQCAYVFYNALLSDVSDSSNAGRVSGYGVAAGYVGSLLGMIIAVPFVSGAARAKLPPVLGSVVDALSVAALSSNVNDAWVRRNAYLPTALLWLGAAVPLLFFARLPKPEGSGTAVRVPEHAPDPSSPSKKSFSSSSSSSPFRDVLHTIRSLPQTPALLWFLVSNFLYIDVIHTIQVQMGTYSRFAVGLDDGAVLRLMLTATAVAVGGGLLYGFLCQRVTIRTATLVALGNWVVVFVLAFIIRDPKAFTLVGVFAGIGLGGIKVTGRLGLIALVPAERMTEFFGFFTLAGEAASVLGPFLWAATLTLFPDKSPAGYRAGLAVLFVVLVFAIGAFLKVRFPAKEAEAANP
jgi:UMF1 family MFS transporter